jgi:hypothetical protein
MPMSASHPALRSLEWLDIALFGVGTLGALAAIPDGRRRLRRIVGHADALPVCHHRVHPRIAAICPRICTGAIVAASVST